MLPVDADGRGDPDPAGDVGARRARRPRGTGSGSSARTRATRSGCTAEPDGAFSHWYVELRAHVGRSPQAIDYVDDKLDLVVSPDGAVAGRTRTSSSSAARTRARRRARPCAPRPTRVLADPPWPTGWEDWRPDPRWPAPVAAGRLGASCERRRHASVDPARARAARRSARRARRDAARGARRRLFHSARHVRGSPTRRRRSSRRAGGGPATRRDSCAARCRRAGRRARSTSIASVTPRRRAGRTAIRRRAKARSPAVDEMRGYARRRRAGTRVAAARADRTPSGAGTARPLGRARPRTSTLGRRPSARDQQREQRADGDDGGADPDRRARARR